MHHREFKYYSMSQEEKERVINIIRDELRKYEDVLLAILFGSFIELNKFRDVDIAIYALRTDLNYLFMIIAKLEEVLKIPVDVVPLTEVSSRFRYYILTRGRVVLEKVPGVYEALLILTLDDLIREEHVP